MSFSVHTVVLVTPVAFALVKRGELRFGRRADWLSSASASEPVVDRLGQCLLGGTLSASPGRHGRSMRVIDELLNLAHQHDHVWIAGSPAGPVLMVVVRTR